MSDQPEPVAALWEWQFQGLCRTTNPDIFFHPEGERGPSRRRREARAKAICEQCPVLRECREHALAVHEPYGVWGGMTEEEREEVYRRSARPRTA
ncbi:WhiB family transcriptional regulator [Ornithinimicrobium kibberense]|uniref:Transcriptional regulator WhiB n=1 Tax=Ornithinimicrobium kibberense TaxID=282060 RepID=A0ABV5V3G3_9MICO|nr:WhiB family transcriptional regulator [Ornithinimicrobium kibberense]